jgi:hypothetical protein
MRSQCLEVTHLSTANDIKRDQTQICYKMDQKTVRHVLEAHYAIQILKKSSL